MNRTVIITGASRGIGRETALHFAINGYNVALNYLSNEECARDTITHLKSTGCDAIAVRADVSNRRDVDEMVKTVCERYGSVDVLVNNAGIAQQKLFTDISEGEWDKMFDVNVKGTFNCCQAVLPYMIHKKKGKIVNVSSIWGICGASCEVHYSASKAAIIGMTKALAKEVGPSNIQVNCVAPGVIQTDMNSALDDDTIKALRDETPLGVIGMPSDVAQTVFFLASDASDFITGQVISPNGGFVI